MAVLSKETESPRPHRSAAPKKRDKEASKRRLLKAALEVFSKVGYDAATTKMVAARAKLNESLIGRYFDGKQGLLVAVTAMLSNEHKTETLPYPPCATLEKEIVSFLEFRSAWMAAQKSLLRVIISRAILDAKVADGIACQAADECGSSLMERLRSFQKKGEMRSDLSVESVAALLGSMSFMVGFMATTAFAIPEDEAREILTVSAKTFSRGLKPS